jgi:hypothetical protein
MRRNLILSTLAVGWCAVGMAAQPAAAQLADSYERFMGKEPESFDDAARLVAAFEERLAAGDQDGLASLLGLDLEAVRHAEDFEERVAEVGEVAAAGVRVEEIAPDRLSLLLGDDLWPFPFPAVKADGKWAFDTAAGLEEVINRRVGENELQAIETANAYVDAQEEYRGTDWDEDGVLEYARRLISTPGRYDGLYWPPAEGVPESPAGSFVDAAGEEPSGRDEGYFGYRYRIIESQGENVAGGKYGYVINDNMIAGYALIAWPVEYDVTGVKTFVVSHHGTVYEKDLGPESAALADAIVTFEPDKSWSLAETATQ